MNPRAALRSWGGILIIPGILVTGLWLEMGAGRPALRTGETGRLEVARAGGAGSDGSAIRVVEAPWCPPELARGVFGRIEIRRLGITSLIAEGSGPAELERTVGHIVTTVFPGWTGNCVLAGLRNGSLRDLGEVRKEDVIRIDTLQGTYTYEVEWARVVAPGEVGVLDETATPSLTLVIGFPFHAIGPAPDRFVVRAKLIDPVAAATP